MKNVILNGFYFVNLKSHASLLYFCRKSSLTTPCVAAVDFSYLPFSQKLGILAKNKHATEWVGGQRFTRFTFENVRSDILGFLISRLHLVIRGEPTTNHNYKYRSNVLPTIFHSK